jgi:hypothetical protein
MFSASACPVQQTDGPHVLLEGGFLRQEWHHNAAVLVQGQDRAQAQSGQALLLGMALLRSLHDELGRERPVRAGHGSRALT